MALAISYARASIGIDAPLVTVETHLSNGLPSFTIVGLPETAVKESRDRVRSAIINSQLEFPARRITVNLAPAELPKEGSRFDLAIALGILAASGQIDNKTLKDIECVGELALSGNLRPISGLLPAIIQAQIAKRHLIAPEANASDASLVADQGNTFLAKHLLQVCSHLKGNEALPNAEASNTTVDHAIENTAGDFSDVIGQHKAKRALELAAAGGHNALLFGPPGTGKSMLALRMPSILPALTQQQAIEVASIWSLAEKQIDSNAQSIPPYRSPHHTASAIALVGGGSHPRPGEISLAHNGILFLDELPEFDRRVLEVLREPLETGGITISRAARQVFFPAKFQLLAAMNPCPCGFYGDIQRQCQCSPTQINRYRSKISGPLLDRIDLHVAVQRIQAREFEQSYATTARSTENSRHIRQRVLHAQKKQLDRQGCLNAHISAAQMDLSVPISTNARQWLLQALDRLQFSTRVYHRVLKLARTIADIDASDDVDETHLKEALSYRQLDRLMPNR